MLLKQQPSHCYVTALVAQHRSMMFAEARPVGIENRSVWQVIRRLMHAEQLEKSVPAAQRSLALLQ